MGSIVRGRGYAMRLIGQGQSLDLFINIVHQGGGKLSQTKRKSQFPLLTDEEIERFVSMVNEAFEEEPESHEGPSP